jgi:hypothetical protein
MIDKNYLTGAWVLLAVLMFELVFGLGLYFSGSLAGPANYLITVFKSVIVHGLLFVPINSLARSMYIRNDLRPRIKI